RGPRVTRETARGLRRHRHDRAVPAPFAGESTGRAVRRSGDLRLFSRGGREARFPARLRGSLRSIVVSSGGGAPAGEGRRANGEGRDPSLKNPAASRWRAPVAAVVSGVLFALAFPPLEWAILLPVALVPWLVALAREDSRGRALMSGFLFGMAYWTVSIPWIVYVVTHYGGQSPVMGVVCLLLLAAILAE